MVASGWSYVLGKIAASDRKNRNTQSIFTFFFFFFYIADITKSYKLNTTITYTKIINNNEKRDYGKWVFL